MAVLRAGDVAEHETPSEKRAEWGRIVTQAFGDAGGLTQYGAYVQVLHPGARTSNRHWHEVEDEFLLMLEGEATVIENDGAHVIGPGDACAWPGGVPNAHCVENRSDTPCRYLIVGTRPVADRCHYPDLGRTQVDDAKGARLVDDATGDVLQVFRER